MGNISPCFLKIFHKASGTFELSDCKSVWFSGKVVFFFLTCSILREARTRSDRWKEKSVKELQHQNLFDLESENISCVASTSTFQEVFKNAFYFFSICCTYSERVENEKYQ